MNHLSKNHLSSQNTMSTKKESSRTVKTSTWILIIGFLFVLSCVAMIYNTYFRSTGAIAYIYQNGECIYSIDLSTVTEPTSFVIEEENGSNTILIEEGRICISEADCPDQVCVQSGWLTNSAAPIVCLPHKLVISLQSENNDSSDQVLDGIVK